MMPAEPCRLSRERSRKRAAAADKSAATRSRLALWRIGGLALLVHHLAGATIADAEPRTRSVKGEIVAVENRENDPDETCRAISFKGVVVQREFEKDAQKLTGFTIEHADGARDTIGVLVSDQLDMALIGNVVLGLQRLTRLGRRARGGACRCGAGGRALFRDADPATLDRLEAFGATSVVPAAGNSG